MAPFGVGIGLPDREKLIVEEPPTSPGSIIPAISLIGCCTGDGQKEIKESVYPLVLYQYQR